MKRKWYLIIACIVLVITLTGCGKSVEEQIDTGVESAQKAFEENPLDYNTTIGMIQLYLPEDFKIEENENPNNVIITEGKDSYILFVNFNEKENSRLQYQLLMDDSTKKIIKEEEQELDDLFGFTAVVENGDEEYELIVSCGGVKMTTISKDKNIDEKLETMMQIVRSVKHIEETAQSN